MRALVVLLAAFLLVSYAAPLRVFLGGGLDYDAARHGDVVLLGTKSCTYCARMRSLLWAGGVPYQELDVERDPEGRRRFEALGAFGVPVLIVGDNIIHGYDPDAVRAAFSSRTEGSR